MAAAVAQFPKKPRMDIHSSITRKKRADSEERRKCKQAAQEGGLQYERRAFMIPRTACSVEPSRAVNGYEFPFF
jgi:hypothetical protein